MRHWIWIGVIAGCSAPAPPPTPPATDRAETRTAVEPEADRQESRVDEKELEAKETAPVASPRLPAKLPQSTAPARAPIAICGLKRRCKTRLIKKLKGIWGLQWLSAAHQLTNQSIQSTAWPLAAQASVVGTQDTVHILSQPDRKVASATRFQLFHEVSTLGAPKAKTPTLIDDLAHDFQPTLTRGLQAVVDRGGRLHIQTSAGAYAHFDTRWQVGGGGGAAFGVDDDGRPWFLTRDGELVGPDGQRVSSGIAVEAHTPSAWLFDGSTVHVLFRSAKRLVAVRFKDGAANVERLAADSPNDCHGRANLYRGPCLTGAWAFPRAVVKSTSGVAYVYQRSRFVNRTTCKRVACQSCEGRDCLLGSNAPACPSKAVTTVVTCRVPVSHGVPREPIRKASLNMRLAGAEREVTLISERRATTLLIDVGSAGPIVGIETERGTKLYRLD